MNEPETRAELVDPALETAGWGVVEGSQIRREYKITEGRLQGAGRRANPLKADYVLVHRTKTLAVIEAKRRDLSDTEGVGQAKAYASKLDIRYAYSTNGEGIYQIDMKTGTEGYISRYPSPQALWDKTYCDRNTWRDRFANISCEIKGGRWQPRYYQSIAIDKAMEAIAQGRNRMLLTLATGTGKTAIAFQIAWKLFKSRWTLAGDVKRRPRILFLTDRNFLANQAFNAFSSFPSDAMVRIDPDELRKRGRVPKNASIFFTIFQTFMSGRDDQGKPSPSFGEYPPDFFDFVIIDECHRGGAHDESRWRGIMDHFSPAVQLGLTATPKRDANVDTYEYFGEPLFVYSLKEGINDGFLTPFKVQQFTTSVDDYRFDPDDYVLEGEVEESRLYVEKDFNRIIEIKEREAHRVKLFMGQINHDEKTIVFCATQDHALAVRDLVNQMKRGVDPDYCVRVTANEGELGERHLRIFQDNEKTIPTILTTSRKLSTGLDARNVRNIVLMRPIGSMVEFKQIIGRGTRLYDGKDYFTIYDFVKAYHYFNDFDWDGEPIEPPEEPIEPSEETNEGSEGTGDGDARPEKIKIKLADGKERAIQDIMVTTFWNLDGKPFSASQFVEYLFGRLPSLFKNEDELRELWGKPETRKGLLAALAELGFGSEQLEEIRKIIGAERCDLFDALAYIAYATPPMTRKERVERRRNQILSKYDEPLRTFLEYVLAQYIKEGSGELGEDKLTGLVKAKYHSIEDAISRLGTIERIREAFLGFQPCLYHYG